MATQRIEDGRLTISFNSSAVWDMLVLSDVTDRPALKRCLAFLDKVSSGRFSPEGMEVTSQQLPRGGVRGSQRSSLGHGSHRLTPSPRDKKKLKLMLNSR